MTTVHTCLFTGEVLTDSTKEEHTIPESLGGRIESRIVSSSDFNEKSGNYLDPILKSVYEPFLNHLAPLLPSANQPGKMAVEVPGEKSGLYLERGEISRKNVVVTKDDDGKIVSATGENPKSLEKIGRQLGKEMKLSLAPATDASFFLKKSPVIAHEIEIAALRSAMLTFDHCLDGNALRFTRDAQLDPVRRFVADAVTTRQIDSATLHGFSLGVQYEKLGLYKRLRQQVTVPPTAFEHVLFAAANSSGRCLDLVWSVFGIDPFVSV